MTFLAYTSLLAELARFALHLSIFINKISLPTMSYMPIASRETVMGNPANLASGTMTKLLLAEEATL
jgi:hypothetical protein